VSRIQISSAVLVSGCMCGGRVFRAPWPLFEGFQSRQAGIGIFGAIDTSERLGDGLPILP
jgi:hypothetical protein